MSTSNSDNILVARKRKTEVGGKDARRNDGCGLPRIHHKGSNLVLFAVHSLGQPVYGGFAGSVRGARDVVLVPGKQYVSQTPRKQR